MTNEIVVNSDNALTDIKEMMQKITEHHKKVSHAVTPKAYIKKKMGMDYVEYSFMRDIADKEFPGWSWEVQSTETLSDFAYLVHGRLKWFDNGVWRTGDAVAAHRIQKKRNSKEYVDIGNDVKAANTDCIKKAFNMYMNIADDVYRNQIEDVELTQTQHDVILDIAAKLGQDMEETILEKLNNDEINGLNYQASLVKLERMVKKL